MLEYQVLIVAYRDPLTAAQLRTLAQDALVAAEWLETAPMTAIGAFPRHGRSVSAVVRSSANPVTWWNWTTVRDPGWWVGHAVMTYADGSPGS